MEIEIFDILDEVDEFGLDKAENVRALLTEIIEHVRENAYEFQTIETDILISETMPGINTAQSDNLQKIIRSTKKDIPPEALFERILDVL
ncbi:MAG: hypothetical protein EMLJLAPB_01026 [Candidatus Argoarchaeum ethanivorans]|uniref:Uncharacterized protein n=1 Tax=Candidatus Argoarchaeum ethanivorans TaxID=2608793 RepID=A0A811THH7_9EURY|nr:MAG: hypothetical protein FFODKBPE_00383 [Candidatus Argoarchaeum ethanivorans]CAD6494930.1 MAG: hypothetical protein EMLJLAPB_01026 [Candidatus Argoarchaeum ethanivorans]